MAGELRRIKGRRKTKEWRRGGQRKEGEAEGGNEIMAKGKGVVREDM